MKINFNVQIYDLSFRKNVIFMLNIYSHICIMKVNTIHSLMVKKFVLFVWVMLPVVSLSAQGWLKNFGTRSENLNIQTIEQTNDGGYFQCGYLFANGSTQLYLSKLDAEGIIIAQNKILTPALINVNDGVHMVAAADGSFFINYATDTTNSNNNNINLLRVNQKCQILWSKKFSAGSKKLARIADLKLLSDNTLASLITVKTTFSDSVAILKTTQQGDSLWFKALTPITNRLATSLVERVADKALFFSTKVNGASDNARLYKTDAQGNFISSSVIGATTDSLPVKTVNDLKFLSDGNLVCLGSNFVKIDTAGKIIWNAKLELANYPNSFVINKNGSFSTLATIATVKNAPIVPNVDLISVDASGNTLSKKLIRLFNVNDASAYSLFYSLKNTADGGVIFSGQDGISSGAVGQVVKINADNVLYTNLVTGRVFLDYNKNCNLDALEPNFSNAVIEFAKQGSQNTIIRTRPDAQGNYIVSLDAGSYKINVNPLSNNYVGCSSSVAFNQDFNADNSGLTEVRYLGAKPVFTAPQIQVSVSSAGLVKCTPTTYSVSYCNVGSQNALNASISITLDSLLKFNSSVLPYTKNKRTFNFAIGNIGASACGSFSFVATSACGDSTKLGQVLSIRAHAYPDTFSKTNTSSAYINVDGKCDADSVRFIISNSGRTATGPKNGVIIVDDVIFLRLAPSVDTSHKINYSFPKNGKTYRAVVDQMVNVNSLSTQPTTFVEGCGTDATGSFTTGFVNQFPEDDADFFLDQDNAVLRDKISLNLEAMPQGYGFKHYIKNSDGIEYIIRYKNPVFGLKDTATNVLIRDTLSTFLNVNAIELGASSNAYRADVFGENILKIFVDTIKSTDGEWGFVKFRIQPKTNIPSGTIIFNTAYINDVSSNFTASNAVFHTIGSDYIITALVDVVEPNQKASVKVYPNPFIDYATFVLGDADFSVNEEKIFEVYNLAGQLVNSSRFTGNEYTFQRNNLTDDIYIFKINSHDLKKIASGKLLISK